MLVSGCGKVVGTNAVDGASRVHGNSGTTVIVLSCPGVSRGVHELRQHA